MESPVSSFRLEYRITNQSNREMVVKTQGGLNYVIRKSKSFVHSPIRRVHVQVANARFADLWLDAASARTRFDQALLMALEKERQRYNETGDVMFNNFPHDLNVSILLNGAVAEADTDVVHSDVLGITLFNNLDVDSISALNSTDYTLHQLFEESQRQDSPVGSMHYFIYLNDPLNTQNPIYTNVMGRAVQVPVVAETHKDPGLYVGLTYSNATPQSLYYSFDKLDKDTLLQIGLFKTKAECELGGNTDRAAQAESKLKDVNGTLTKLSADYAKVVDLLETSEGKCANLGLELAQVKQEHRAEIQQLKNDHRMEIGRLQITSEMTKARGEIDKTITKANMDFSKARSSANNWGEVAKAVGAIATVLITGYRLCTS